MTGVTRARKRALRRRHLINIKIGNIETYRIAAVSELVAESILKRKNKKDIIRKHKK